MTIKPYPQNAKKHPNKQLKQIAASLKEFGWRQPIVVDKNDVIIVGHGRWMAYEKYPEGIKEPWIIKADDLTDEQVKAYRLADNKLNESEWDYDLQLEEFESLDLNLQRLTGIEVNELADNREIAINDLGDTGIISFKFSHIEYLALLECLANAVEKTESDTNEDFLKKVLQEYV